MIIDIQGHIRTLSNLFFSVFFTLFPLSSCLLLSIIHQINRDDNDSTFNYTYIIHFLTDIFRADTMNKVVNLKLQGI